MTIEFDKDLLRNAAYEAIWWWNRDEWHFHHYFSKLDEIRKDEADLRFFSDKLFGVFLNLYSVRRTIKSGNSTILIFLQQILERDFVEAVKKGDKVIIDKLSDELKFKSEDKVTNRQTISLLSKAAFLINPHDFSLFDTNAKTSLGKLLEDIPGFHKSSLNTYDGFIEHIDKLLQEADTQLSELLPLLDDFMGTAAFQYFSKKHFAFKRRILDKYLWLVQIANGRPIDNSVYPRFYNKWCY